MDQHRINLVAAYAQTVPIGSCFRCQSASRPLGQWGTFGQSRDVCLWCIAYFANLSVTFKTAFVGSPDFDKEPTEEELREFLDSPEVKRARLLFIDQFDSGEMFPEMTVRASACWEPHENGGICVHTEAHKYHGGPCVRHGCKVVGKEANSDG